MKDMAEHEHQNGGGELQAPEALAKALRQLQKERVFIPPSVDERILSQAREQIRRATDHRRRGRSATRWLALAACIVVLGWLARTFVFAPDPRKPGTTAYAREDVNHDGRVDILDAFELSRVIQLHTPLPSNADFNGDGRVDGADVEIIARHSVRLEKGRQS